MSGISQPKTLPLPYTMNGYHNQQNQNQGHLQHQYMAPGSKQQQQQQQQPPNLSQHLDNINMRMNAGGNLGIDFASGLPTDSWNQPTRYGTTGVHGIKDLNSLAIDSTLYSNNSTANSIPLASDNNYQNSNNQYSTSTSPSYHATSSATSYQQSLSNSCQTSNHLQGPVTQSFDTASTFPPMNAPSFQTPKDACSHNASFAGNSSILMSQSFPTPTEALAPLPTTEPFSSTQHVSFTTSSDVPNFLATSQPQNLFGISSVLDPVQAPIPRSNIVVPVPSAPTGLTSNQDEMHRMSPMSSMTTQQSTALSSTGPKMSWNNTNGSVVSTQNNPIPVWVPIHAATGTSSAFVRISEVPDDEPSPPVPGTSGLAHSPMSVPAASIQGSPGQYKPLSGGFNESPVIWGQQKLPSVSGSLYSQQLGSNGVQDTGIVQSIENRPSTGDSQNRQSSPPSGGGGARPWATPTDWISYRDIITQLYIEEDKPLKEVMDFMAKQYSFHATEKMYKIKIKKWNLKKNLRENEVQAIIQAVADREAMGKASAVTIHGKPFELSQIFRHAKKKGILRSQRRSKKKRPQEPMVRQDVPHYVRIHTPSPPPEAPLYALRPPDSIHVPEQILSNLNLWMSQRVSSGAWAMWLEQSPHFVQSAESNNDPSGASVTLVSDFYNHFLQGLQVLRTSGDNVVATRSFNIAFGTLKNVMLLDDPRVIAMLVLVGLRTEKEGHGRSLGEMLWRYVSELSPACLGVHSPLNRVWGSIASAFIYNDAGQSMVLIKFLADQLKQFTDNASAMYMDFFMFQSEIERLCYGQSRSTRQTLLRMLDESRLVVNPNYQTYILQKNILHQLARSYIKDGCPEEARICILQTPHPPLNNSRSARIAYLDLLANIELACGSPQLAAETMEKGVYISTQYYGEFSSSTMYMADTLIKIYQQIGAFNKAQTLAQAQANRERFLENFHSSMPLPPHVPPVQIGATYEAVM